MGGLLGMMLAARAGTPIRRLVVNDIGPYVSSAALARIKASHARADVEFATLDAVERQLRVTYATFGPLDEARWRALAAHGARRTDQGTYRLACDPAVVGVVAPNGTDATPAQEAPPPLDLWRAWDRIRSATLVLRGERSDVLTQETAQQMRTRGPRARLVEFAGVGHAPWLMDTGQIQPVRDFLLAP